MHDKFPLTEWLFLPLPVPGPWKSGWWRIFPCPCWSEDTGPHLTACSLRRCSLPAPEGTAGDGGPQKDLVSAPFFWPRTAGEMVSLPPKILTFSMMYFNRWREGAHLERNNARRTGSSKARKLSLPPILSRISLSKTACSIVSLSKGGRKNYCWWCHARRLRPYWSWRTHIPWQGTSEPWTPSNRSEWNNPSSSTTSTFWRSGLGLQTSSQPSPPLIPW